MTEPANDNAWRKMTDDELQALAGFTLHVEGLSAEAVRRVRMEYRKMLGRAVGRFLHHLGRPPDEREARLLAKAIVGYLNSVTIPIMAAPGGRASLH